MIFNREEILEVGLYDTAYKVASDFDLVLKLAQIGKVLRIPDILSEIEPGGISNSLINLVHTEKQAIRKNLFKRKYYYQFLGMLWTQMVRTKMRIRSLSKTFWF
jgi:hypothetical protein